MQKRILFLSTHSLATNPRLYKEMQLALKSGFDVEAICFEFDNWSKEINESLKKQLSAAVIVSIPAGRKPFIRWITSILKETFFRIWTFFMPAPGAILSQALSRRSDLLISEIKKLSVPQLVIGHNPGAMWPTLYASERFKCPAGFDMEDFHPGEGSNKYLQRLCLKAMKKFLHRFKYISFASFLILAETRKCIVLNSEKIFPILNLFPSSEFKKPVAITNTKLKLIWFSQNVGFERGLEKVVPVIDKLFPKVELHLFGNVDANFFKIVLKEKKGVFVHPGISQKELHKTLSEFDVGLAIEPGKDLNNSLAVSNKLLAYLQAGLYVIATKTPAQNDLMSRFSKHGICVDTDQNDMEEVLIKTISLLPYIRKNRIDRYIRFKNINWESESVMLRNTWEKLAG